MRPLYLLSASILCTLKCTAAVYSAIIYCFPLLLVSCGLLYQVKNIESRPSEAIKFICSNNGGPVIMWTITSLSSGFSSIITFHSIFDTPGVWRSAVIDDSVANATLHYGNSSWYLTFLMIPSTVSSDIRCNFEFLQYHSSSSGKR